MLPKLAKKEVTVNIESQIRKRAAIEVGRGGKS